MIVFELIYDRITTHGNVENMVYTFKIFGGNPSLTNTGSYKMYSLTSNSMTTTFHVNPFIQGIIPEHDFIVITR